jgi:glycerol uptake facilitator-like aquaporin
MNAVDRGTSTAMAAAGECVGTMFLLIAVVGSGIAAQRLSGGSEGLALLANALATATALFVLILALAPVSGAHLNPAVTLTAAADGRLAWRRVPIYIAAQVVGAVSGTWLAHAMFALPLLEVSHRVRTGTGQWLSEGIATLGLLGTILGCRARGTPVLAAAVASYIGGAYWFTASTAFANPAATVARALTDTFAGIRPADVPGFIAAQLVATAAFLAIQRLATSRQ